MKDVLSAEECENDTYLEAWNRIPPHDPTDYLYAFLARYGLSESKVKMTLLRCRKKLRAYLEKEGYAL